MLSPEAEALRVAIARSNSLIIDLIGGVILATNARNAIDIEKLRDTVDEVASRPDVDQLERACIERLLRLVP